MSDLFDGFPDQPGRASGLDRPARIKGSGLYADHPGTGPVGETCRSCDHSRVKEIGRRYYKCNLVRALWTGGYGTDIKARSPACSKWKAETDEIVTPPYLEKRDG